MRIVGLVVLLGVAGTGVYWFGFRSDPATAASGETTSAVAASTTTFEQSVSASGTLTPAVQESVSFEVPGTVASVDVSAGDTVTAGQQLATVDTLQLNADLLAAKSELVSAQANLSNAQDEADGSDSSDAQIASLGAQVEVAQAAYDQAEEDMAGATLTAPVDGLLTEVNVEVGDSVGSSSSSTGGSADASTGMTGMTGTTTSSSSSSSSTAQFVIIGTESWSASVTVDETDVALISVDDQVELTGDSLDDTVYGTVSEIGLVSTSSGGVASYPVTIQVTGSPEGLHDGASVTAEIIYQRRTDVLAVPSAAVTTEDGQTVVKQEGADGEQVTTVVTVGETSGTMTEITEGLSEGDEVLVTTFTPGSGNSEQSGDRQQQGQMPDFGSGEMPEMPSGGQMPQMPQMGGGSNG
ncbi:efflux RND transporter periplasmic adaptor subunit [Cellulomonas denverensis]|uniref:Biotin/lipoyl-binding protein n=1 Tax=Cellulomonas denverensis TaxID=264297 RepID=A0A7X6KSY7_9CELL|nr:biotin/lipoyl-binding protein [Cellulomonas denverensis]NKY21677.1 biotin/lipoyl-binding protein [Cellulomonas denverensis]